MALRLEEKKIVVSTVTQVATSAHSALAMEYQGLTASELTGLRAKAREQGVCLKVVKNTLAKRALKGTPYECMCVGLVGPNAGFFTGRLRFCCSLGQGFYERQ